MAAERCPECLLTPQAKELLERLEAMLQRTRPGDASWETTICPRCGRLTGIFDEREGWSVGEGKDRGWASGPKPVVEERPVAAPAIAEAPRPTPPSRRLDLDALPIPVWVTVREAAFLSRVSEEKVLEWIGRGIVEHETILRDARHTGSVFVRSRDLDPALARDAS